MRGENIKNKKAQVTIFVIIALVIVVFGTLIYFFYPEIKSSATFFEENPKVYIQNCVEKTLEENVKLISSQGGRIEPESFISYKGNRVEYLCYANRYYEACVVQKVFLVNSAEDEIKKSIEPRVNECFNLLKSDYEKKGYVVEIKKGDLITELLPKKILVRSQNKVVLTKESPQNYNLFDIVLNNNLYELLSIGESIVTWEKNYGDFDTGLYMTFYPELKIEKNVQSEGTKVYIITDRDTENKLQFAVRGMVFPPGIPLINKLKESEEKNE